MKKILLALLIFFVFSPSAYTQTTPATGEDPSEKILKSLNFQQGDINLHNGLATVKLSPKYRYLNPVDSDKVLVELWGNPKGPRSLGMIFPANVSPEISWGIEISYEEEGYIKDDEATKIDYAKLLKEMQEGAEKENPERIKKGFPPIHIIGWATPPRYDAANHKLFWAKEIKFGDDPDNTLNYNLRILGRRGVLQLNVIGGMNQLKEIQAETPEILQMVDFNPGNRYADYNPSTDKLATYGIAALIAGGAAAKMGFFKGLWVALLAGKKFIFIGTVALGSLIARIFKKNKPQNGAMG